ncbi:MAG: SEL1-like repeat protein [Verrucomicrobiota bacterium]
MKRYLLMLLIVATNVAPLFAQGISAVTRRTTITPAPGMGPLSAANGQGVVPQSAISPGAAPRVAVPVRVLVNVEKTEEEKALIARKTLEFQQQKAEAGASYAQFDLALRYLSGDGVPKNKETALKWLRTAATNGHSQAIKKLSELEKSAPDPDERKSTK